MRVESDYILLKVSYMLCLTHVPDIDWRAPSPSTISVMYLLCHLCYMALELFNFFSKPFLIVPMNFVNFSWNKFNQIVSISSPRFYFYFNWRPPSLSELTLVIFDMELTHLGSEASNFQIRPQVQSTMESVY